MTAERAKSLVLQDHPAAVARRELSGAMKRTWVVVVDGYPPKHLVEHKYKTEDAAWIAAAKRLLPT